MNQPAKKLSRSRLENLYKCRLCGYLEIRYEIKAPSIPFTLNIAVDELLKKDFDKFRETGEIPPVIARLGKEFVPFQHPQLENWRDFRNGAQRTDQDTGITVYGAIDDLWATKDGEVVVLDYKATAKASPVRELGDLPYHDGYRRQLDIYGWLLEGQGLKVSASSFLFYVTARKSADGFMGRLEFDPTLIEHKIDTSWISPFLKEANEILAGGFPASSPDCRVCEYRNQVNALLTPPGSEKNG